MADRVFFVASSPEEFIRGVSMPEEMLSDLLAISRLSVENIEQISTDLQSASGFLDDARLKAVIGDTVKDEQVGEALARAIRGLRPQSVEQSLAMLRTWRQAAQSRVDRFPDESLQAIETILPRLIRPYPALERQRKAHRLKSLTGNQIRETEIVCDARPVFDPDRRSIEGFVTQTILKIVFDTQQEEGNCIELVLTEKQLKQLGETVGKAQRKLEVLRASIQGWIPNGLSETAE